MTRAVCDENRNNKLTEKYTDKQRDISTVQP